MAGKFDGNLMGDINYLRIRVIYVLRPCVVGFALCNVRDIFFRKWPLVVFNISVAYHDFKTKAQNYSILMRMPSISIFVSFDIVSFVEDAC